MVKLLSSLRSRLILLVVLTSIPGIIFLVQTGLYQRNHAMQATEAEVIHLAQVASNVQSVMLTNVKSFLITLAHLPTLRSGDLTECQGTYSHLVEEHFQYYSSFYIAGLQKNILCSPPTIHDTPDFEECHHYSNLVQADDFVIKGYHICKNTGKAVISIGYPIKNIEDETILVSNVSLDLIWFYDFAADSGLTEGTELIIIDEEGTILSYYPENDRWRGYPLPSNSVLASLFEQKEGVLIGSGLSGEESIFAISPMNDSTQQLYVALGMPTRIAFATANQTMWRNLGILLAVMVAVITLMWFLGEALIVKQAQTLVQATGKLASGDLSVRSGINYKTGELGQLAEAFDKMAVDLSLREAERDRNEAELADYAHDLEITNQELRDFTNIASHDLQEPLRKIQTFGELLQERSIQNLDPRGVDYIRRMQAAAQRMQILIDELLAYSRVTTKARPFIHVDLNRVVNQVLSDLDWQIEQKQADIQVQELPFIEADPVQITQLMQNLISNALKFHKPNYPPIIRIYGQLIPDAQNVDNHLELIVEDEGIGFNEKYCDRIFQPFQRLHGRKEYEGVGMGLAICRKIVDRHGGHITAVSKEGQGARFIIRLPEMQPNERSGKE